MAAEDILLKIGAVDNASAVFAQVRDAVTSGLSAITGSAHGTAAGMDGVAASANTARLALIATGVGAAIAVVAGISSMVIKARELGEQFFEMSQRTGASTESLSTLKFVAEQSGLTIDQLESGMTKLARSAGAALQDPLSQQARLFTALGVTLVDTEGKMRPTDQLMKDMADKLVAIKSPGERAAVAMEVFGRAGTQLLPMLLEGSAGIQTMQDRAKELGLEMSGASAAAADQLGDKWDELTSLVGGLAVRIGGALVPGLVSGVSWLIKIGETAIDAGRIMADVGAIAFEPWRLGWNTTAQAIYQGIIRVTNFLGEAMTTGVNAAIGAFNSLGEHIGVTIDEIDWTPLTTGPAVDFAEEWEASKNRVAGHWESIKGHSRDMRTRLISDTNSVGTAAGNAAGQVEEFNFKMADLQKETQDATPDLAAMRAEITAFHIDTATSVDDTQEFKQAVADLIEETKNLGPAMNELDWEGIAPPPTWGTEFSASFANNFKSGLRSDTSSRAIGEGLGTGLSNALGVVQRGGGFGEAAAALGTAIGTAVGGPIGGLIGQAIGGATSLIGNLFGGTSRSKSRQNVVSEIQQSITQGDLRNFAAFNNLSRAMADAGSARLTLDAVMKTFGLEAGDAATMLQLLTNQQTLSHSGNAALIEELNLKIGAVDNRSLNDLAASLVPAAVGFDGMVNRPTLFLAGEAGPEHVNVTPGGQDSRTGAISLSPTFNISANTAADGAAIVAAIRRDALPLLERELDRMLRRGSRYGNLEIDDRTLRSTL